MYLEDNLWGHFSPSTMRVSRNREGRDRLEALRPFELAGSFAFFSISCRAYSGQLKGAMTWDGRALCCVLKHRSLLSILED